MITPTTRKLSHSTLRLLKLRQGRVRSLLAIILVSMAVVASAASAGYYGTAYVSTRINVAKSRSSAVKSEAPKPLTIFAVQDPVPPAPPVTTDKTGYLVGEAVNISGTGFTAGENVTIQVRHADNSAESGGSHDPFGVTALSDGTFSATWNLTRNDSAGNDFVVSAVGGSSGYGGTSKFKRIATVRTDKFDYEQGETVAIQGNGFAANETVTIHIVLLNGRPDGNGYSPFTTTSDENGQINASWPVDPTALDSILLLTARGSSSGLKAQTIFTDVVVTVIDDKGADDEPGQKDLSQLSTDNGNLPTSIGLTWNWDDTAWSGNNTGDACSLFDTDGDGFANFALCVTVSGNPAEFESTRLYSCGDTRSDRCDQPTVLISTFTSTCTATIPPNSDPFKNTASHSQANKCSGPGCITDDTVAACTVRLADFGSTTASLLNVCTYPSAEPNSAPAECVITPNSGFLTIKKTTQTNENTSTDFVFNTNPASQSSVSQFSKSISGQQSEVVVASMVSFAPTNTLSITEVVPSEWDLTGVTCTVQSNVPQSTGTFNGTNAVTGVSIQTGLETVCIFTDAAFNVTRGKIKVAKVTDPANDSQTFQFDPSYESSFSLSGGQDHTSGFLTPGSGYSVTETVPSGWDKTSATCTNGTPDNITVVAGQTTTCTFTNTKRGHLIVQKTTDPANDPTSFTISASGSGTITGGGAGSVTDATDQNYEVTPGTYSVAETVPAGWDKTGDTCQNVSVAAGQTKYCLLTNTKRGMVTVTKYTNGQLNQTMVWNFSLVGTGVNTSDSTPPTLVDFGGVKLIAGEPYRVCETSIPAGWTLEWKGDSPPRDGTPDMIIPFVPAVNNDAIDPTLMWSRVFDPNYVAPPAVYTNDTRCVNFKVAPGETLAFSINNSFPGGEPRTIGYWKNWSSCTGGNQIQVAAKNGGPAAGWYTLDNLLNNPGYTIGILHLGASDCLKAVRLLDKSEVTTGKKLASDAAYNLAAQLLAAELNLSAGAETCPAVIDAVTAAQNLLASISFNGTGSYLKKGTLYNQANALATTLDRYNNGLLCP